MKRVLPWMLLGLVAVAIVALFVNRGPRLQVAPTAISDALGLRHGSEVVATSGPDAAQHIGDKTPGESREPVGRANNGQHVAVSPHAGFWIDVVFADDGAPAVSASVQAMLNVDGDWEREGRRLEAARRVRPLAPAAPSTMLLPWPEEQVGEALLTDAQGRLRLLELGPGGELRAWARRDGVLYRGERQFSAAEIAGVVAAMRLELFPAFEGSVLVLDAEGAPVPGIAVAAYVPPEAQTPVDAGATGETAEMQGAPKPSEVLAGAVTDADGRALLLDPSNRVARALEAGESVTVEALALLDVPSRAALVPGQTTVLQLPPTGSVALELAPGSHSQFHEYARAALFVEGGTPSPFHKLFRTLDGGRTRFAHVGVGLRLAAELHLFEEFGPFPFAGPAEPGEEVHFVLPKALGIRVVQFHLVEESGLPITDTWVRVRHSAGDHEFVYSQLTDGAGRMRVECGHGSLSPVSLELEAPGTKREGSFLRTLAARVDLGPQGPLPADFDFHDAGELVLRPLPILATGRVLDASGAATPGAFVVAEPRLRKPSSLVLAGPASITTRTNLHGEFLLEGETPGPTAHLVAVARGFGFSEPKPLVQGPLGIDLVLGGAGAVRVTLILPPGLGMRPATARLVRAGDTPLDLFASHVVGPRPVDRFSLERDKLEPGIWTVEVISVGDGRLLWRDDVDVPIAGTVDLGDVDLTQQFPVLEVRATRADGQSVGAFSLRRVEGNLPLGFSSDTTPIRIPQPADGTLLEVTAAGYLPSRASVAGTELDFVLEPLVPARLVLPPGLRVPSKALAASLSVQRLSGSDGSGSNTFFTIEATGEYLLPLGVPGRFRLRVVDLSSPRSELGFPTQSFLCGEFEVRAIDLEQNLPIELPIDAGEWLKLLERHDGP